MSWVNWDQASNGTVAIIVAIARPVADFQKMGVLSFEMEEGHCKWD